MFSLALGGQKQTGQHAVRIGSFSGASTETDFSKNNHVPEGLFGLIIGWLNTGVSKKSKEAVVFFIRIDQSEPYLGILMSKLG